MMFSKEMDCQILGIGLRKTGEKNGRKYDFIPVCIAFDDKNFEGRKCLETIIEGELFDSCPPILPDQFVTIAYHWYKKKDGTYGFSIDNIM